MLIETGSLLFLGIKESGTPNRMAEVSGVIKKKWLHVRCTSFVSNFNQKDIAETIKCLCPYIMLTPVGFVGVGGRAKGSAVQIPPKKQKLD